MRATTHMGRTNRHGGTFRAGHNDRSLLVGPHVDLAETPGNVIIYGDGMDTGVDFETAERGMYDETFRDWLWERNRRYIAHRNFDRIKGASELYEDPRTCPQEVIMGIGSRRDGCASPEDLETVLREFLEWHKTTFPAIRILDVALHQDEPMAACHIHLRSVYVAKDKDGHAYPNQRKALEQMGLQRPDPSKPVGRYNNAKQTYTDIFRGRWQELAMEHGFEIETEPREPGKSGLALAAYKVGQIRRERDSVILERDQAREEVSRLRTEMIGMRAERNSMAKSIEIMKREYDSAADRLKDVEYARKLEAVIDEIDEKMGFSR